MHLHGWGIQNLELPNHKHAKLPKHNHNKYPMTNLWEKTRNSVNTLHRQPDKQPSQACSMPITSHVCCLGSSQPEALQLVLLPLLNIWGECPNYTAISFRPCIKSSFQKIAMRMSFKCPYQEFQICRRNGWFVVQPNWTNWTPTD